MSPNAPSPPARYLQGVQHFLEHLWDREHQQHPGQEEEEEEEEQRGELSCGAAARARGGLGGTLTAGPGAPVGPAGPGGPASPLAPASPVSPLAPGWPSAPCGTRGQREPGGLRATLGGRRGPPSGGGPGCHTYRGASKSSRTGRAGLATVTLNGDGRDKVRQARGGHRGHQGASGPSLRVATLTGAPRAPVGPAGPGGPASPWRREGKQEKKGIRAVARRWRWQPGHFCPRGMSPPCHQEHQQGRGGRWDRSGLGDRPCQERHQHLWDRGHPEGGTQGWVTGTGPLRGIHPETSPVLHPHWDRLAPSSSSSSQRGIGPKGWGQG